MATITVEQLRAVNWGKSFLWDVEFPLESSRLSYKSPDGKSSVNFAKQFPAIEVEENLYTLNSKDVDYYIGQYKIPQSTAPFAVTLTFYDDVAGTIRKWLAEWVNIDILNNGTHISFLENSVKQLTINKYETHDKSSVDTKNYWVYPDGSLAFRGTSESDMPIYSQQFVVAGVI
tara:strand:+ start:622 stop:1143 length:522 start_codon:yes stop_codon:yes gene_type:complete